MFSFFVSRAIRKRFRQLFRCDSACFSNLFSKIVRIPLPLPLPLQHLWYRENSIDDVMHLLTSKLHVSAYHGVLHSYML